MKKQTLFLGLLLVLALASCNTSHNTTTGNGAGGDNGNGGNNGDGGASIKPIDNLEDFPTVDHGSQYEGDLGLVDLPGVIFDGDNLPVIALPLTKDNPTKDQGTHAILKGTYDFDNDSSPDSALFVVAEKGVYALDTRDLKHPVWKQEPLAGTNGQTIKLADAIPLDANDPLGESEAYLFVEGSTNYFKLSDKGEITKEAFPIYTSSIDTGSREPFRPWRILNKQSYTARNVLQHTNDHSAIGLGMLLFQLSENTERAVVPIADGGASHPYMFQNFARELLGFFPAGDKDQYFINKRDMPVGDTGNNYMLLENLLPTDENSLSPFIQLPNELQKEALVGVIADERVVISWEGESWKLRADGSIDHKVTEPSYPSNEGNTMPVIAKIPSPSAFTAEKIVVGTNAGFYEFPDLNTVSGKMTIPSDTVHTGVYNRRDLRNLAVTGFYTIDGLTYVSSSRGVWVIDHSTKMLWEL